MQRINVCALAALAAALFCACRPDNLAPAVPPSQQTGGSETASAQGGPGSPASSGAGASDDELPKFGAIPVKNATGATIQMRSSTISGEEAPHHVTTDPAGDVLNVIVEDAAHVSGDTGILPMARVANSGGSTSTAGDNATFNVTDTGGLRVSLDGTPAVTISGTPALPTGAATESTLSAVSSSASAINTKTPPLGQTSMANSVPVTIASDQGALPITISSVTVSTSALPTGAATEATLSAVNNEVSALTSTEDAAFASGGTGVMGMARVADSGGSSSTADDVATLNVTSTGELRVAADIDSVDVTSVTPGIAATSLGKAEDAAHASTDVGVMALARVDNSAGSSATGGDYATLNVNDAGELRVAAAISSVGVTSLVPGVGNTSLGKAEDAAHASGDTGVLQLAVRNDAGSALAGTDGDYAPLQTDNFGKLRVSDSSVASYLATIDANTRPAGQTTMAFSTPVTIASNQTAVPISASSLPLPSGAATETTLGLLNTEVGNLTIAEDIALAGGELGITSLGRVGNTGGSSATAGDAANLMLTTAGDLRVTMATGTMPGLFAEDTAHGDGDIGMQMLALRANTSTTGLGADGDYSPIRMNANGALYVSTELNNYGASEDAASSNAAGLLPAGVVRRDTLTSTTSADGDWTTTSVDSLGATWTRSSAEVSEDAAHVNGDRGMPALGRVDDFGASSATTGDYATFNLTTAGELRTADYLAEAHLNNILITTGSGTLGLGKVEDVAHASADVGVMPLARVDNSAGSTSTAGDYATLNVTTTGDLRTTVSTIVPGTAATNQGKAEDAAHASSDTGVMALAVRRDTAASSSSTDGDYSTLNTDATGHLWTRIAGNQLNPYATWTPLNGVATNVSQTASAVDVRGYKAVTVVFQFLSAGSSAIGKLGVLGSHTTPVTSDNIDMKMENLTGENGILDCDTVEGDSQYSLDATFTAGSGVGSCSVVLENPPPYIAPYWTRTSGGTATAGNGLYVFMYGTAF